MNVPEQPKPKRQLTDRQRAALAKGPKAAAEKRRAEKAARESVKDAPPAPPVEDPLAPTIETTGYTPTPPAAKPPEPVQEPIVPMDPASAAPSAPPASAPATAPGVQQPPASPAQDDASSDGLWGWLKRASGWDSEGEQW